MCNHVVLMSLNDSNGVTLADENANSIFDADVDVDLGRVLVLSLT